MWSFFTSKETFSFYLTFAVFLRHICVNRKCYTNSWSNRSQKRPTLAFFCTQRLDCCILLCFLLSWVCVSTSLNLDFLFTVFKPNIIKTIMLNKQRLLSSLENVLFLFCESNDSWFCITEQSNVKTLTSALNYQFDCNILPLFSVIQFLKLPHWPWSF